MKGGLTVAILKKNASEASRRDPDPKGPDRVVDFTYNSEALARMIVDAWVNKDFRTKLLKKENAKACLAERGLYLENPVVISEVDYFKHHTQDDDNEIVFVLPDERRVAAARAPGQVDLLETAKLLMAITPNGI